MGMMAGQIVAVGQRQDRHEAFMGEFRRDVTASLDRIEATTSEQKGGAKWRNEMLKIIAAVGVFTAILATVKTWVFHI